MIIDFNIEMDSSEVIERLEDQDLGALINWALENLELLKIDISEHGQDKKRSPGRIKLVEVLRRRDSKK